MRARRVTAFVLAFLLVGAVSATAGTLWGTYNGYSKVKMVTNGTEIAFGKDEVPAFNVDGTTVLPLRTVVDEFGLIMNWDADNQTVELYKPNVHMTIVRDVSMKNGVYVLTGPGEEVSQGSSLDFVVFAQVDNLKVNISKIDLSIYTPSGELLTSNTVDYDKGLDSFWSPFKFSNVSFTEKGVYKVKLSFKAADSGQYFTVSEKQIVSK